jgi:tRNA threonylcarbamoyladenosine biosynthesis protein TsaB
VKILAIDTASANCSAALLIEGRMLTRALRLERGHAEHLLPMVDELLHEAGFALRQLDALAFGRGPGAFTGLRLAASVAQGLAFGAGLPVIPVSDLLALAQQALTADTRLQRILVCSDARMQEVYWGCFERGLRELAVARGGEHVGSAESVRLPEEWLSIPAATAGAGTGFSAYPPLREGFAERLEQILPELLPRAEEIARLAVAELGAGRVLSPELALPVYLRNEVTQAPPVRSSN